MRIRRISSREPNKCPGMDQQKAKTGGGGARVYLEEANPSGWERGWKGERRRKYIECFLFVQIHLNFK